jgi:hypothetical protein
MFSVEVDHDFGAVAHVEEVALRDPGTIEAVTVYDEEARAVAVKAAAEALRDLGGKFWFRSFLAFDALPQTGRSRVEATWQARLRARHSGDRLPRGLRA